MDQSAQILRDDRAAPGLPRRQPMSACTQGKVLPVVPAPGPADVPVSPGGDLGVTRSVSGHTDRLHSAHGTVPAAPADSLYVGVLGTRPTPRPMTDRS